MCRTLLKPGIPYAKANWRKAKPHISMRTNTVMQSSEWTISDLGMLCMMISLGTSSSPQSGALLSSLFVFAFHCYWASTNILLYAQKPWTGLPLRCPSPALIHPSAVPLLYTGPPQALLTTPSLLFDITLLWLSGPLCWLLSEADWRPFVRVSPCPEWPRGTCWAVSGETGMRIWMG